MSTIQSAILTVLNSAPVSFFESLTESDARELYAVAVAVDETMGTSFVAPEIANAIAENTGIDV